MATRSTPIIAHPLAALAAILAAALLAASAPAPLLGADEAAACPVSSTSCGG